MRFARDEFESSGEWKGNLDIITDDVDKHKILSTSAQLMLFAGTAVDSY